MSLLKRRLVAGCRQVSHRAAVLACAGSARTFDQALADVRGAQLRKLEQTLRAIAGTAQAKRLDLKPGLGPEAFRERAPEIQYADVATAVEQQRGGARAQLTAAHCRRYQPTSGSSAKVKWIPYTAPFLADLDAAVSPGGLISTGVSPASPAGGTTGRCRGCPPTCA